MRLVLVQPELAHDPGTGNFDRLARLLEPWAGQLDETDVVLLPEHVLFGATRVQYGTGIAALARQLGCHVVGGSHHELRDDGRYLNVGLVCDARGQSVVEYEKLRPYGDEQRRVEGGSTLGEFAIEGRRMLSLVCADFWFSDVFQRAHALPDLVLVPAYSVSRKPSPDYSRQLWRHLATARAYEFGVFVGVSDWAHMPALGRPAPSGVAGFADPTTVDPGRFFRALGDEQVRVFTLDFDALAAFRADRRARGFFWRNA